MTEPLRFLTREGVESLIAEGVTTEYSARHLQDDASDVWIAKHSLGYFPNVTTVDSSGNVIEGNVSYPSIKEVRVEWTNSETGEMYLT